MPPVLKPVANGSSCRPVFSAELYGPASSETQIHMGKAAVLAHRRPVELTGSIRMISSPTGRAHSSASILRRVVRLMAGALLGLFLLVPAARADTNSDMTSALSGVNGTTGWNVRQVSSSGATTLSGKNSAVVFEPASTIKFLHHLTATLKVQANPSLANALTPPWYTPANDSCPVLDDSSWVFGDPLAKAMSKMMWNSDNGSTEAIKEFFGEAAINQTAQDIGASNTLLQHRLGCGDQAIAQPNKLTLIDASKLYRAAFTGNLLTEQSRKFMRDRMLSNHPQFTKEAQAIAHWKFGKPVPVAFTDGFRSAYKAGGYGLCDQSGCKRYVSVAGYVEIPRKSIYGSVPFRYTFGLFMHGTTTSGQTISSASQTAMRAILREEITKALDTWL